MTAALKTPSASLPYWVKVSLGPPAPLREDKLWRVSRYADVLAVLRHPDVQSAEAHPGIQKIAGRQGLRVQDLAAFLSGFFVTRNPPFHTALRLLYRSMIRHMEEATGRHALEGMIRRELDRLSTGAEFEAIEELCNRLPVLITAAALGLPEDVLKRIRDLMPDVLEEGCQPGLPLRAYPVLEKRAMALRDLVVGELLRPDAPPVIADLVAQCRAEGQVCEDELIGSFAFFVSAAAHTTGASLAATLYLLALHGEIGRLAGDPALTRRAIDEALRYGSVIRHVSQRVAARELTIGGVRIPEGAGIWCDIDSAHFDPDAFAEPERFDITREGPTVLAFGSGAHACLGANLARAHLGVFLDILSRDYRYELSDPTPEWMVQVEIRRPLRLPIRMMRAR